jgi:hypothetical protein
MIVVRKKIIKISNYRCEGVTGLNSSFNDSNAVLVSVLLI